MTHINESFTAFGVTYKNLSYIVVPSHANIVGGSFLNHYVADIALLSLSSVEHLNIEFGYFDLDNAIAKPSIGDSLFAIGFDDKKPDIGHRIWVGSVYSPYFELTNIRVESDINGAVTYHKHHHILTGGHSEIGMSGAPVFNGCGIYDVSVGIDMRFNPHQESNVSVMHMSGVLVEHIDHLVDLLKWADAEAFVVPSSKVQTICHVNLTNGMMIF